MDDSATASVQAEHTALIAELQRATDRLEQRLGVAATKDDVTRVEQRLDKIDGKLDGALTKALDSAPPWAVREIGWLRSVFGAGVAGAVAVLVNWASRHFGQGS